MDVCIHAERREVEALQNLGFFFSSVTGKVGDI